MTGKSGISRRQFLGSAAIAAGAITFPNLIPASALGRGGVAAPSERIAMASIGIGGRGSGGLGEMLSEKDVQVVAVCDVRRGQRENAKKRVDEKYGSNDCVMYSDFQELLAERKDLDAVYIATSERWHTPISIAAMKLGKDVYCEKPSAFTIAEAQALAATAKRYGRVFQTGAQRASQANFIFAGELMKTGRLGTITAAYAHLGCMSGWPRKNSYKPTAPEPSKDELDWNLFLGPVPWRPYEPGFADSHGYMSQYDMACGIAQWGAHTILQCQLDLGVADTSAVEYEYTADLQQKGMTVRFANGARIVARCSGWHGSCGVRYEGTDGWVATADGYEKPELSSPVLLREYRKLVHDYIVRTGRPVGVGHLRDLLDCMRTRRQTVTNVEVTRRTMITNLAMDICLDLKRDLKWDPIKEEFIGDEEANRLRSRAKRSPWIV